MTYSEYIEKYGNNEVWSSKYKTLMQIKCKEAGSRLDVRQKISQKQKAFFENNKELALQKTEKMRNSPNRLKNLLDNYKNMSKEEHEIRVKASQESWKNEEKRKNRINAINNSEKYAISRKKNWATCLSTIQPIISKPARQVFEYLTTKKYKVDLEFPIRFYHLDIALPEYKICVEIDGDYWHGNQMFYKTLTLNQISRHNDDKRKDTFLKNRGWQVLRFWQSDLVKNGFEQVSNAIDNIIKG
jgi:very-short-patch-repair endonuclease